MSYRRVWVLLNRLPQESWTQTILRDSQPESPLVAGAEPKFGPWALENYQMASLLDAVRHLEYVLARVNGNEDYDRPEPTAVPGRRPRLRVVTPEAATYLNALRAPAAEGG